MGVAQVAPFRPLGRTAGLNRLGKMGSGTVYGWGDAFTSMELLHPTPGFIDAASSQGGAFPPPRRAVQNECVIRVLVGADSVIRDWDWYGNARGCRVYADRLAGRAVARAD